jgi:hypothetical protein
VTTHNAVPGVIELLTAASPLSGGNMSSYDLTASSQTGSGTYVIKCMGPWPALIRWAQYGAPHQPQPGAGVVLNPGEQMEVYCDETDTYGRLVAEPTDMGDSAVGFWRKA